MSLSAAILLAAATGSRPAPALIEADTPLAERLRILAPFFEPPPGQVLKLSERSIALRRGEDQMLIKGEFWIKPPPGQCLVIRKDLSQPDRKVCRATPWNWELFDLDAVGRYSFTVIAGPNDQGTPLTWTTPYRSANYIPVDAPNSDTHYDVPLKSCTASIENGDRKIVLELFDGRRWLIYLPEFDDPVWKKQEPLPNLIVRTDSKKEPPVATSTSTPPPAPPAVEAKPEAAADTEKPENAEGEGPTKRRSILSQLLSGDYKTIKDESYAFRVSKRNAYQMSSSHFMETSVPQGMNGVCRYKFSGAPGDPSNGVIECYDTDAFQFVYALVSCFSEFAPRLDPNPPKRPAEGKEKMK